MRTSRLWSLFFLICSLMAADAVGSVRVIWDSASARPVQRGVYARVRVLSDNRLALVYSDGGAACIRFSHDQGASWDAPVTVAKHAMYVDTNSELVELRNGWLLYGFNSRPSRANPEGLRYMIRTILSKDGGKTWLDERDAFAGGTTFGDGCWEPAFLQFPSGEVGLYFANEAPYTTSNEQEISMLRSKDNGLTWSGLTTVSFRKGCRDGMPVPLLLADGRTVVVAIEDNGYRGAFKPVIIRSSVAGGRPAGPVLADSPAREGALRSDVALEADVYAGAPYLAQLPTGETLLVVQSSAGRQRGGARYSRPVVYVGTSDARDFAQPSVPFPLLPADASANWNSLTVLDRDTVMLVSSLNGVPSPVGPSAVWTMLGRIVREPDPR